MRIGFATIYSFRPHVEHAFFLSTLLGDAGHEISFLTCHAAVRDCYTRLLKGTSKVRECPKCILGSFRGYPVRDIWSIDGKATADLSETALQEISASSAYTLLRVETPAEARSHEVKDIQRRLKQPIEAVYESTRRWIQRQGLDAVICFNGRIDLPRTVIQACGDMGLPYITFERSFYGHGLHLIPNADALSLRELDQLATQYRDVPLTLDQARLAGKLGAARFLQKDVHEFRLYNPDARSTAWPSENAGEKVLIVPSSRNEFMGHTDYICDWEDNTQALDSLMGRLGIDHRQCVLRSHPNWAERIGLNDGARIERHYRDWAGKHGVYFIGPQDRASTYDLIKQADLVVVNGSSCGYEAGLCGKKVVCLSHSAYQEAGIAVHVTREEEWPLVESLDSHEAEMIARRSLRYIYLCARRLPQYVDYVRAQSTTKFDYYEGADPGRLIRILQSGQVEPDDPVVADTTDAEDEVLEDVLRQDWSKLYAWPEKSVAYPKKDVGRRRAMRWIDPVRELFPKGDL